MLTLTKTPATDAWALCNTYNGATDYVAMADGLVSFGGERIKWSAFVVFVNRAMAAGELFFVGSALYPVR